MGTEEYVAAGLIIVAFLGGWTFNGYRWEARMNEMKTEYATVLQKTTEEAKAKEEESSAAIAEIDTKHTKELTDARKEIDRLRSDVAAGAVRLRVRAKCVSDMPKTTSSPGLGDAGTPVLDDGAKQHYFALVSGIKTVTEQLKACQAIVIEDRK